MTLQNYTMKTKSLELKNLEKLWKVLGDNSLQVCCIFAPLLNRDINFICMRESLQGCINIPSKLPPEGRDNIFLRCK